MSAFSAAQMLVPGARLGSYELIAPLKAGGMATLWLGRRAGPAGFSRHVAIKIVHPHLATDPSFVRMFLDEARLAARIQHANVVHTEELGEASGMFYLAMEYVHGCTLSQLIQRLVAQKRGISPELAVHVAMKVADGLHAAHEARDESGRALAVVHRDVSPQNVLLSYTGQVKLIDFGVAKAEGRDQETTGSSLKGKIRYMAPEQAWGRAIDRRTDVYALGIVLWECLTHIRLFAGGDDFAALERVRAPNVPPPSSLVPGLPAALDGVVLTALAPDPASRFQTAQAFRRALGGACPAALAVEADDLAALTVSVMAEEIERERQAVPAPAAAALEVQAPDPARRTGAMQALTRAMPAVALDAVVAAAGPAPVVPEPSGVKPAPSPARTPLPPTLVGAPLAPPSPEPVAAPPARPSSWLWVAAVVLPALAGAVGGVAWMVSGELFSPAAPGIAAPVAAPVEAAPSAAPAEGEGRDGAEVEAPANAAGPAVEVEATPAGLDPPEDRAPGAPRAGRAGRGGSARSAGASTTASGPVRLDEGGAGSATETRERPGAPPPPPPPRDETTRGEGHSTPFLSEPTF